MVLWSYGHAGVGFHGENSAEITDKTAFIRTVPAEGSRQVLQVRMNQINNFSGHLPGISSFNHISTGNK